MCVYLQDLSEVLYWLSNQAVVHWLTPRPRLYFQNMAASKIIQVRPLRVLQVLHTAAA